MKTRQISESDSEQYIKMVPGFSPDKNPLTPYLGAIGRGDDVIQGLIVAGMLKNGDLDFKDSTTGAQVTAKVTQARYEYQKAAQDFALKNGATMDQSQLSESLTRIAEQAAQDASGIPLSQLREMNDATIRGRKYAEFVGKNTPTSLDEIVAHPDKPNTFNVKGYGIEVGYSELPLVFKNANEFNDSLTRKQTFLRLGLTETKDQKRFMDLQLKRLKDAGLSK